MKIEPSGYAMINIIPENDAERLWLFQAITENAECLDGMIDVRRLDDVNYSIDATELKSDEFDLMKEVTISFSGL